MKPASMLFGLLLTLGSGCYANSLSTGLPGDGIRHEKRHSFFLGGLVGEHAVELDDLCRGGTAAFGDKRTFVDGLLGAVTLGIYTPRTSYVECAAYPVQGPAAVEEASK